MSHKTIAVLPGDGIGNEVMAQALNVLERVAQIYGHDFTYIEKAVGGAAIDQYGEPLPTDTLKACEESDAILFGSVGGPKWDHLSPTERPEVGALLPLRKHFDLFANLRPFGVSKQLSSFCPLKDEVIGEGFAGLIVRELTSGIYFGEKAEGDVVATDIAKVTRKDVERIARTGFQIAQQRGVSVTSVDKANVLATSRLWRKVMIEIQQNEFPEVELHHLYIDNATMQMLVKPHQFGVVITPNLFGDILSDEAAQISGSIGLQASASINADHFGLYEPMGGSAPDIADQDIANPIAQILSAKMMLELSFGMIKEAKAIEDAVQKTLDQGFRTGDIWTEGTIKVGTKEMGAAIVDNVI